MLTIKSHIIKLISLLILPLALVLFVIIGTKPVIADTACGPGNVCVGTNTYLKVNSCKDPASPSETSCLNNSITNNAAHSCPTGGGAGSCTAFAPGKNGCNGLSRTVSCSCVTAGGVGSCSFHNTACSFGGYNGTCSCTSSNSCAGQTPQGGNLGCCAPGSSCGDGACDGGETCSSCTADCGACGFCGNGTCGGSETCTNCAADCGACAPSCGDGTCNGTETCSTCSGDCGACAPSCGDASCNGTENCSTCTADCGDCGPSCGDGSCNAGAGETCNSCSTDCGSCPCTPSCGGAQCGQSDGCSGNCSNADSGAPGIPTITPANGGTVNVLPGTPPTALISWSAVGLADQYDIELYPQGTSCADSLAECTTVTSTQYSFVPDNGVSNYTFRVRARNTSCGIQEGSWGQSTFGLQASISGSFFVDNGATVVGGLCTSSGASAQPLGPDASIGATNGLGSYTGSIVGSNFVVTMPYVAGTTSTVTLDPGSSGSDTYTCACPGGCAYSVNAPINNVNFYLTASIFSNEGWWQVSSGHTFAGNSSGTTILSAVPYNTCTSAPCIAAILTDDLLGTVGSAGVVVTGGGDVDSTKDPGANTGYISERSPQAYARGTDTTKFAEKYAFFYREYSLGLATPSDDFTSSATDAVKPTAAPTGGKSAYFHQGDLTIRQRWTVTNSESIVIFINGNLTIDDPSNNLDDLITVEPGGFLAFIVSGNITIQPNVGNNAIDAESPNVEGVYIADGTITVESRGTAAGGDDRFVGAGNFIGWGGINLNRDFSDGALRVAENNDKAVELFFFRPDFVRNLPEQMARPRYIWQETN